MINVQLLRKELEYITDHRDEWVQSKWFVQMSWSDSSLCKTQGCLFGNALSHAGKVKQTTSGSWAGEYRPTSGKDWVEAGAKLFGLNRSQAEYLADESNSLYRLWTLANEFTNGEIEIPPNVRPAISDL